VSPRLVASLLTVLVAGAAAWLLLRPSGSPLITPEPGGDALPMARGGGPEQVELPKASRESLADAAERLPQPATPLETVRLTFPDAAGTGSVTGEQIRTALLEVPQLYLRWESEAAKQEFVAASIRVPPDAYMPREQPIGARLPQLLAAIRGAGFAARFEPPRVVIGPRP